MGSTWITVDCGCLVSATVAPPVVDTPSRRAVPIVAAVVLVEPVADVYAFSLVTQRVAVVRIWRYVVSLKPAGGLGSRSAFTFWVVRVAVESVIHFLPATFARSSNGGPYVTVVDILPVLLLTRMFTGFGGLRVLLRWLVSPYTAYVVNGVGSPVSGLRIGTGSRYVDNGAVGVVVVLAWGVVSHFVRMTVVLCFLTNAYSCNVYLGRCTWRWWIRVKHLLVGLVSLCLRDVCRYKNSKSDNKYVAQYLIVF